MPKTGIDFSAVVVEEIAFTTTKGKRYLLRDDVSWDVIFDAAHLRTELAALQERAAAEAETMTADEAQHLIDEWCDNVAETVLPIFRNTDAYAQVTKAELLTDFGVLGLLKIVDFFSTYLGEKFSTPPTATATVEVPSNRAQRRSATAQKRH